MWEDSARHNWMDLIDLPRVTWISLKREMLFFQAGTQRTYLVSIYTSLWPANSHSTLLTPPSPTIHSVLSSGPVHAKFWTV